MLHTLSTREMSVVLYIALCLFITSFSQGADPDTAEASEPPPSVSAESDEAAPKRAVARKSTASRKQEHLQTNTTKWEYEGTISSVDVKPIAKESFKSHVCTIK